MTTHRDSFRFSATLVVLASMAVATPTHGQSPPAGAGTARAEAATADALYQGFVAPPPAARPRVWWHWMNGNVTKEGIRRDLEWMKRVGLGGFQNFDASLFGDTVVDKRVAYMTPEWKDAFRYAIELADQLGLETAIAGSPGWSESGGAVGQAGAGHEEAGLERDARPGGPAVHRRAAEASEHQRARSRTSPRASLSTGQRALPELYRDVAVVAYRVPASDQTQDDLRPIVTSSGGAIDASLLADGDLVRSATLPAPPAGEKAWIQFEYEAPQAIRAVTLAMGGAKPPWWAPRPPGSELQASDDGRSFRPIAQVPRSLAEQNTVAFEPVRARFFRVTFPAAAAGTLRGGWHRAGPSGAARRPGRGARPAHGRAGEPLRGEGRLRHARRALRGPRRPPWRPTTR